MIIYNYLNRISRNSAFASVAYKKFSSEMRCNLDQKCPKTAGQLQQLLMFASTSNVSVRKKHSWTLTQEIMKLVFPVFKYPVSLVEFLEYNFL